MSTYNIYGNEKVKINTQVIEMFGTDDSTLTYNGKRILTQSDLVSLGPVGNTPNANGLSLVGGVLNGQPASSTQPGFLTAGTQIIGGAKEFAGGVTCDSGLVVFAGETKLYGLLTANDGATVNSTTTLNDTVLAPHVRNTTTLTGSSYTMIDGSGSMSSYAPTGQYVKVSLDPATTTIPPTLTALPLPSTGIVGDFNMSTDAGTNCFILRNQGTYIFDVGLNMVDIPSNTPSLFCACYFGTTPGAFDLLKTSDKKDGGQTLSGQDNPYHFRFEFEKTSPPATFIYVKFSTTGNSYPTTGTAPSWATGSAIQVMFFQNPRYI